SAIVLHEGTLLQAELSARQRFAFTGRTEILPARPVVETELAERRLQIVDVHPRGEPLAAPGALRAFALLPNLMVELHAELGRALENVKELSEREKEERGDYGDGVQDRKKTVEAAAQPERRGGEREAGDRDGEEQDKRKEVAAEILHRADAAIAHPPPERKRNPAEHHHRRDVQPVEQQPG